MVTLCVFFVPHTSVFTQQLSGCCFASAACTPICCCYVEFVEHISCVICSLKFIRNSLFFHMGIFFSHLLYIDEGLTLHIYYLCQFSYVIFIFLHFQRQHIVLGSIKSQLFLKAQNSFNCIPLILYVVCVGSQSKAFTIQNVNISVLLLQLRNTSLTQGRNISAYTPKCIALRREQCAVPLLLWSNTHSFPVKLNPSTFYRDG